MSSARLALLAPAVLMLALAPALQPPGGAVPDCTGPCPILAAASSPAPAWDPITWEGRTDGAACLQGTCRVAAPGSGTQAVEVPLDAARARLTLEWAGEVKPRLAVSVTGQGMAGAQDGQGASPLVLDLALAHGPDAWPRVVEVRVTDPMLESPGRTGIVAPTAFRASLEFA